MKDNDYKELEKKHLIGIIIMGLISIAGLVVGVISIIQGMQIGV